MVLSILAVCPAIMLLITHIDCAAIAKLEGVPIDYMVQFVGPRLVVLEVIFTVILRSRLLKVFVRLLLMLWVLAPLPDLYTARPLSL